MKIFDLIGSDIHHQDDGTPVGQIVDAVVDLPGGTVPFALVQLPPDDAQTPILFSLSVLKNVGGKIVSSHHDDASERAKEAEAEVDQDIAVDPTGLPSVVVGPFGNAVAPAMLAALLNSQSTGMQRPDLPEGGGHWMSKLRRLPVFDQGAELGDLHDIGLSDDLQRCETLIIRDADGALTDVDAASLRHLASGATHIVLNDDARA